MATTKKPEIEYCRSDRCSIEKLHEVHDLVKPKSDNSLRECPVCAASVSFGRCKSCGWKSEWAKAQIQAWEERRKLKVKKAYGPRAKPELMPDPKRVVTTESGVVLFREYTCPICDGKGWMQNYCNSCIMCFGKGVIGFPLFRQWWFSRARRKDGES